MKHIYFAVIALLLLFVSPQNLQTDSSLSDINLAEL